MGQRDWSQVLLDIFHYHQLLRTAAAARDTWKPKQILFSPLTVTSQACLWKGNLLAFIYFGKTTLIAKILFSKNNKPKDLSWWKCLTIPLLAPDSIQLHYYLLCWLTGSLPKHTYDFTSPFFIAPPHPSPTLPPFGNWTLSRSPFSLSRSPSLPICYFNQFTFRQHTDQYPLLVAKWNSPGIRKRVLQISFWARFKTMME